VSLGDFLYWLALGLLVGIVKGIEAYFRPRTAGNWLLAIADGATAILAFRVSSTIMIGCWTAARYRYDLPPVADSVFMSFGIIVALLTVKQVVHMLLQSIPFLRGPYREG
jgi:hypothetical protein